MLAFEESRPFIFRVQQSKKKGLLDLEGARHQIVPKVENCSPNNMASLPRRLEPSL